MIIADSPGAVNAARREARVNNSRRPVHRQRRGHGLGRRIEEARADWSG